MVNVNETFTRHHHFATTSQFMPLFYQVQILQFFLLYGLLVQKFKGINTEAMTEEGNRENVCPRNWPERSLNISTYVELHEVIQELVKLLEEALNVDF